MKTSTNATSANHPFAKGRIVNIRYSNTQDKDAHTKRQYEISRSRQTKIRLAASAFFVTAIVLIGLRLAWSSDLIHYSVLFFSGLLCWTYVEYIVHRFYVHTKKHDTPKACGWYPNRPQRLKILVLWMTMLVLAVMINHLLFFAAGLVGGWLWYCYMRVFVQWKGMAKLLPGLHRQHLYHLAGGHDKGFGWTTTLWDTWFHTNVPMGYIYSPGHMRHAALHVVKH